MIRMRRVTSGTARCRRQHEHPCRRRGGRSAAAQAGAGDLHRDVVAVLVAQGVLAVAQEGEVVVRQPLEEAARLARLARVGARGRGRRSSLAMVRAWARIFGQSSTESRTLLEHVAQVLLEVGQRGLGRRSISTCIHDSRTTPVESSPPVMDVPSASTARSSPVMVRSTRHLRVHDEVHAAVEAAERRDDRVDEEGHVVDDDLHDGVGRRPALVVGRRVERAHVERCRPGAPARTRGGRAPSSRAHVPGGREGPRSRRVGSRR